MYWCYIWLRLQVRLEPAHLGAGFDSGWVRSRQKDAVVHGRLHGISRGRWAEIASQIKYSSVSKQICAKVPTYNEPHAARFIYFERSCYRDCSFLFSFTITAETFRRCEHGCCNTRSFLSLDLQIFFSCWKIFYVRSGGHKTRVFYHSWHK